MIYAFDDFEVDDQRFELRRHGIVVAMQRRAFDLLLHLVRHAGVVCTRDQLRVHVWDGAVVTKDAMAHAAIAVRAALENGCGTRYVETVRGRGYLLNANVVARPIESGDPMICTTCGQHRSPPPPLNRGGVGDPGDWRPQPNVF